MSHHSGVRRALVVGYGSIGQRHWSILSDLGLDVAVVSSRPQQFISVFAGVEDAVAAHRPEYVVIASPTSRHHTDLAAVQSTGFTGPVLIEKPVVARSSELQEGSFTDVFVGYNLRFHPVVVALRSRIAATDVLAVQVYAGQYLPDWRPGRRYQETSSAKHELGGGVLRDLSHDLDLLLSVIGPWEAVAATGGTRSRLEIDSDDLWAATVRASSGAIGSVQLDYLNRPGARRLTVVSDDVTIEADVMGGTITSNGITEHFEVPRDQTFRDMHEAILTGDSATVATYASGADVLRLIAAFETSAREERWVRR